MPRDLFNIRQMKMVFGRAQRFFFFFSPNLVSDQLRQREAATDLHRADPPGRAGRVRARKDPMGGDQVLQQQSRV